MRTAVIEYAAERDVVPNRDVIGDHRCFTSPISEGPAHQALWPQAKAKGL